MMEFESVTGGNALERLSRQLHASVQPENLACRWDELDGILDFVREALRERRSQSLYISGVPGTGKSACVHKAVSLLREEEECPEFPFVSINGMHLSEASELYTSFLVQLDPKSTQVSATKALDRLNNLLLGGSSRQPIVLLADELDAICTGRQSVVYQLFEWATRPEARLVVLAVANTLDLPERLLSHRVSSRLGMARQYFQPYEFAQVVEILEDRLGACAGAVEPEALELISRKVAAQSGDLRMALHIAREAIGLALEGGSAELRVGHVQAAIRRLRDTVVQHWVRGAPSHARLLLEAVLAEHSRTGHEDIGLAAVAAQYRDIATLKDLPPLPPPALRPLFRTLVEAGLLLALPSHSSWHQPFRLNIPAEDLSFALQDPV